MRGASLASIRWNTITEPDKGTQELQGNFVTSRSARGTCYDRYAVMVGCVIILRFVRLYRALFLRIEISAIAHACKLVTVACALDNVFLLLFAVMFTCYVDSRARVPC